MPSRSLSGDETLVNLRCSVVVARRQEVLLLRRKRDGREDFVLPGGRPRTGEGVLACATREVAEESGVRVVPTNCALVADVIAPGSARRGVELVFVAHLPADFDDPLRGEDDVEPCWVDVAQVRHLRLLPPIAGYLPSMLADERRSARYVGNLWRPDGDGRDGDEDRDDDDPFWGWR